MHSTTANVIAGAVVLAAIYVALRMRLRATQDPREPPMIENMIPFITPILGMTDNKYFLKLKERYKNLPIFTLRLPAGARIYVINDPQLIAAVQRQAKVITFQAIEDKFSHRICNLSPTAVAIQKREADIWVNGPANASSPAGTTFKALSPGKYLDEMNRTMTRVLEESVEDWVPKGTEKTSVKLFEWVKEMITVPTTEGIYGSANPYRDAAVRRHYWIYSAGVGAMTMGRIGKWIARDSINSRDILARIFEQYFLDGHHYQASGLTKQRYDWYINRGFPLRDYANLEVGHGIAILGNTVPTTFWFILHIFSDPKVLEACRGEVLGHVVESKNSDGTLTRTLDVMALKASCPILQSTFKEAMRVHGKGVGLRGIMEDHVLDGKYLLRKDATVFMPSTVQHFDRERWGADAPEYHHDRFTNRSRPRVNNIAFRAFGGGTTLCPGRHFATTEILTFAAMLMLRFEVVPRGGYWVIPSTENARMTAVMPRPDFDLDVDIRRREDDKSIKWVWKLSESKHEVILGDEEMSSHKAMDGKE